MLIRGQNRMSRIASCLEAAHHFLLPRVEALAIVEAQLRCIGENWDAVCTEAAPPNAWLGVTRQTILQRVTRGELMRTKKRQYLRPDVETAQAQTDLRATQASIFDHVQRGFPISGVQTEKQRARFFDVLLGAAFCCGFESYRCWVICAAYESERLRKASHCYAVDRCFAHLKTH
jgi:hypothetical protein